MFFIALVRFFDFFLCSNRLSLRPSFVGLPDQVYCDIHSSSFICDSRISSSIFSKATRWIYHTWTGHFCDNRRLHFTRTPSPPKFVKSCMWLLALRLPNSWKWSQVCEKIFYEYKKLTNLSRCHNCWILKKKTTYNQKLLRIKTLFITCNHAVINVDLVKLVL